MWKLAGKSQIMEHDELLWVNREGIVTYVDGRPSERQKKRLQIRCTVQPLKGLELLIVPEADRFKEMYYVWGEDGLILINDKFEFRGGFFQVQQIENWGSYTRGRMVRIDVGADATVSRGETV